MPRELFGICVAGIGGDAPCRRRRRGGADDHERRQAVRVRPRLRAARPGRGAAAGRRQRDRAPVQLARRRSSGAATGGRTRWSTPARSRPRAWFPGRNAEERWRFIHEGLSRFAGRELALDDEVYRSASETNHRNQSLARLLQSYEPALRRPGRGGRPLHAPVLPAGHRARPRGDGRDARRRRRQPAHARARRRRGELPLHARRDGDRRPVRDLRRLALRHRPARARAASAAASSPSPPARAGWARSRRCSTRPATASRGSSPRASSRAGSASTSSPRSPMRESGSARRCSRRSSLPPTARADRAAGDGARRSATPRSCGSSRRHRLRAGRAVRADRRRRCCSTSRRWRCAARGQRRPGQDRPDARRISREASTSTTSTSPGNALDPGCDYLHWQRRLTEGHDARRLRARRHRSALTRASWRSSTGSSTSSTTGTTCTRATGR